MTTETIFFFAIGVFLLMLIGIFLTMLEFNRLTDDPSVRKGAEPEHRREAGRQAVSDR